MFVSFNSDMTGAISGECPRFLHLAFNYLGFKRTW